MSTNKLSYAAASQKKEKGSNDPKPSAEGDQKSQQKPVVKKYLEINDSAWQGNNPALKLNGNQENQPKFGNVGAPDLARTASAPSALEPEKPTQKQPMFTTGFQPRSGTPVYRPYYPPQAPYQVPPAIPVVRPPNYVSPQLTQDQPEKKTPTFQPAFNPAYQYGYTPPYNPEFAGYNGYTGYYGYQAPPPNPAAPAFTPAASKPRTPIKIVNPKNNQEIQLPSAKKATPAPATSAIQDSPTKPKVDVVIPVASAEPKKGIVLKDPVTGETKVLASKAEREKSPVRAKTPQPEVARPKTPQPLPVPERPKSPVKVVERPKSPAKVEEKIEEVEPTTPAVVKSPEVEEGEIEEIFLPDDVRLLTAEEIANIQYPEGVQTPEIKDGFFRYPAEFMIALQNAVLYKPKGIPPFSKIYIEGDSKKGVGMSRQSSEKGRGRGGRSQRSDRTSMSRQNSNSSRGHLPGRRGRNAPPAPAIVKSENAWDAKKLIVTENDAVLKIIKGILNKLTWDTFDKLSDKICTSDINNEEILIDLITFLSQKAVDELHFSAMYAKLCRKLIFVLPEHQKWICPSGNLTDNLFRKLLLKRCQEEFEKDAKWSADDAAHASERAELRKKMDTLSPEEKNKIAEEEYERSKLKRRVLGNIRFVGELFLQDLISEKIIHSCIRSLLKKTDSPEEEDIESLCKLMTSVGKRLDHQKGRQLMDSYFEQVAALSENKVLNSRVRFALMDLLDLRKDNWVPRATGPTTAKSTSQVRKEIEMEERNKQASKSGSRNLPSRQQQQNQPRREKKTTEGGDGWTSIARSESKQGSKTPSQNVASVRAGWGAAAAKRVEKPVEEEDKQPANIFNALETEAVASPTAPAKSQEEVVVDAIKNYKESLETREVLEDIKDIDDPEMIKKLVSLVVQFLLDSNGRNALRIISLFKALFFGEDPLYDASLFIQGFHQFFTGGFEDEMSDFPKAFSIMAQVLLPLLEESLITFGDILEISSPLENFAGMKPQRGVFIKDILLSVEQNGNLFQFIIVNKVDITAFFKPNTNDATIQKWLQIPRSLSSLQVFNQITKKVYELAGLEPHSFKWFNQEQDDELLSREDFDELLGSSLLEYLGEAVIFQNGEPTPDTFTSLQTQITSLQPFFETLKPSSLLKTTESFCREKNILGIFEIDLDEYLGDILFRLYHDANLVSRETFLEYKKTCSPAVAKKLSGWFKHIQTLQ